VLRTGYAAALPAPRHRARHERSGAPGALFRRWMRGSDVPEITEACWGILHKSPSDVMCASSRHGGEGARGAARPAVVACTLLPYSPEFEPRHDTRRGVGHGHAQTIRIAAKFLRPRRAPRAVAAERVSDAHCRSPSPSTLDGRRRRAPSSRYGDALERDAALPTTRRLGVAAATSRWRSMRGLDPAALLARLDGFAETLRPVAISLASIGPLRR